ncbi:ribonuclease Y [Elusimicrobiota bacterium]
MNIIIYMVGGVIVGFIFKAMISGKSKKTEIEDMNRKVKEIREKSEKQIKEKGKEVDEEKRRIKEDFENSTKKTREDISKLKQEVDEKSKTVERKADVISSKEAEILKREKGISELKQKYEEKEVELNEIRNKEKSMLQKIARMSPKEAREQLMKRVEEEAKQEAQKNYTRIVENAKRDAQRESVEVIAQAIQRNASDVTQEMTVATVALPDDDMKGRIIGREGRNIRALEAETGVNIIIDDTPGVITISSFNGVRREIAKRTLEQLMKDGRIQPVRIEEVVKKVTKEVEDLIRKSGEEAALELGITGLHDEEINLLGKLKYRTSYGQNVLTHSIEVARLAGIMAEELEIDAIFARRAGLLHDIGKAIDRDMNGNHVSIGAKLAKKYGEGARLQNAIMAHHEDEMPETAEAVLIQAADTISASRPGVRHENLEYYVKRMSDIEDIAKNFEGVKDAYCVSAGREIRIIVEPNKVSDLDAANIAKICAKKIEEQIDYPGEIKVTVIRSLRNTEMAR